MEPSLINKRLLAIFSFSIVFLIFLWFIFNYSWITVHTSGESKKLITITDENEDTVQSFEQDSETKTVLLRRGTYVIKATKGDEFSVYKKSLGFLWFNRLDIELSPQKSSEFLGKSHLPCAKDNKGEVLFASCSPIGEGSTIISSRRGLLAPPVAGGTIKSDHEASLPTTGVLKHYKNGYLNVRADGSELVITARNTANNQSLSIPGFEGEINDDMFSVSPDAENFVVHDNKKNEILHFNDISDDNATKFPLPTDKLDQYFSTRVVVSKEHIYFFSFEGGHHEHEEEAPDVGARLFIYNTSSGATENEYSIPDDWQISRMVAGPNNQIVLLVYDFVDGTPQPYLITEDGSPTKLDTIASFPQDICWKDKNSFYYLADNGKGIYSYSLPKQASFLVYGGLYDDKFVSDIQCSSGSLYFNFDLTSERQRLDPELLGYYHYKLGSSAFTGIRPESVMPVFVPVGGDVVEADIEKNGVKISVKYEFDNNQATPTRQAAREAVVNELRNKGVLTFDFNFQFDF